MGGDLRDLRKQLAAVMADLDAMPRWRSGSEWHVDRVDEAQWLSRQIERLELAKKYVVRD
jgi:hypothetical protein